MCWWCENCVRNDLKLGRNNKKKGSWKQATVGLMLFRCDYAETTIIIIIIMSDESVEIVEERHWKNIKFIRLSCSVYKRNFVRRQTTSFTDAAPGCCLMSQLLLTMETKPLVRIELHGDNLYVCDAFMPSPTTIWGMLKTSEAWIIVSSGSLISGGGGRGGGRGIILTGVFGCFYLVVFTP